MNLVLVEPEIPPNTGNIARLCAATRTHLHLIEPLGFDLGDRELKRAGMDYWRQVTWNRWPDWERFAATVPQESRLWFIEQGAPRRYIDATYNPGDYLIFGRETSGLPAELHQRYASQFVALPMQSPHARSLNLSTTVAIGVYEVLRQQRLRRA